MLKKVGSRRTVVPEICHEQLKDSLRCWAQNDGVTSFRFGGYDSAKKSSAVLGPDLAALEGFILMLVEVSLKLEFKYVELKVALQHVFCSLPRVPETLANHK